jgi:hypothetical protein
MKKRIVALTSLAAIIAVALAASLQSLNAKTGWWQITETINWTGLPPGAPMAMANGKTISYHSCVKPEDLSTNPWAHGSHESCTWTVVSSNGTDMDVRGNSCEMGKDMGMTADVHGKIHIVDPENGTGSFDITVTGNGQTIQGHASYVGKWVGASCGSP